MIIVILATTSKLYNTCFPIVILQELFGGLFCIWFTASEGLIRFLGVMGSTGTY